MICTKDKYIYWGGKKDRQESGGRERERDRETWLGITLFSFFFTFFNFMHMYFHLTHTAFELSDLRADDVNLRPFLAAQSRRPSQSYPVPSLAVGGMFTSWATNCYQRQIPKENQWQSAGLPIPVLSRSQNTPKEYYTCSKCHCPNSKLPSALPTARTHRCRSRNGVWTGTEPSQVAKEKKD